MKTSLLALLLLASSVCYGQEYTLRVVRVLDGDTVEVRALLPAPLDELYVRVRGIDTPETPADSFEYTGRLGRAGCVEEALAGIEAETELTHMLVLNNYLITIRNFEWGKFGGRIVADVYINGESVADALIAKRLATPYDGSGERPDWCATP